MKIPKTSEIQKNFITAIESKLNQTVPAFWASFIRTLSFPVSSLTKSLWLYGKERRLQSFIRTCNEDTLKDFFGPEIGVEYNYKTSTVLTIFLSANDGVTINQNNPFIGEGNGVRYYPNSSVTAAGGTGITIDVVAETPGTVGNLIVGVDVLIIESPVSGAYNAADITAVPTLGTNDEDIEDYRQRILDEAATVGGGSNGVDYRTWAQQTPGVKRAFPFAGKPLTEYSALDSYPGERTVFIEADSDISTDGIAPQTILDLAREYIDTDPVTGQRRTSLGNPNAANATLYLRSIYRTGIFIEIRNLTVDEAYEYTVKTLLKTTLNDYLRSLTMFVDGVDVSLDRRDTITSLNLGITVDSILSKYGATASSVGFGTSLGVYLSEYILTQGELVKLEGEIVYA